jgi:pyridoxal 5'-phosphate synthase pdxS subunit
MDFVGSGIFKAENPEKMAKEIVEAINDYDNSAKLAEISKGIGAGMKDISADMIPVAEALQEHGLAVIDLYSLK